MQNNLDGYKKNVETLPLIKHDLSELGVYELLKKYVEKGRSQEEPAEGLSLLIMNILSSNQPLYKVEEWLQAYQDESFDFGKEALGLNKEVFAFNDDRFARNLDKLFQADRGSLMAELSAKAIEIHEIETQIIHNDTTTVTFSGEYNQNGELDTVQLKRGYNKDGRPSFQQIVFDLNITEDGHVPISYQIYDGNTSDNNTHQVNWNELRKMIQDEQFIYVADSKLCSQETLNYLDSKGGQFISILPKNRQEVKAFHDKLRCFDVVWKKTLTVHNDRKRTETVNYLTCAFETTREGYPILWVHSDAKAISDCHQRQKKVAASEKRLKELVGKLNRYHLKTVPEIKTAVLKSLTGTQDYFNYQIVAETQVVRKQNKRGKPGKNTTYEEKTKTIYRLKYQLNQEALNQASLLDGIFPIVHNVNNLSDKEILETYKKQSYLEKRHSTFKSVNKVAPVYLKKNTRIEAMLFRNEVALMVLSLIERNIRQSMAEQNIEKLSILPQGMNTKTPTWSNLKYFFHQVYALIITQNQEVLKITLKGLSYLHKKVLRLLSVPLSAYALTDKDWWRFNSPNSS